MMVVKYLVHECFLHVVTKSQELHGRRVGLTACEKRTVFRNTKWKSSLS